MKSLEREKQTGEVFTPTDLVQEMLDKLPPDSFEPEKTFLDNSCGNGQFLIEVLKHKFAYSNVETIYFHDAVDLIYDSIIPSIYGVDLMADNVCDTIARIYLYLQTNKDFWNENAQPLPELNHPGHSDDHNYDFLKANKAKGKVYTREYAGITVRFSHFNKGNAGVFEYSFTPEDDESWTKVYNIVCHDALTYDYEFDQEVKKEKKSIVRF